MDYTGMCSKPTLSSEAVRRRLSVALCRPVGKCGKGGKGGDGSCLEDEDQCVDDFGGTFCSGKDGGKGKDNGGKGKDNGGKGKKGKKGKKDGKKR